MWAVYHSPTRMVWVNGQMQADGPQECPALTVLQKQYKLTPLGLGAALHTTRRVPVPGPGQQDAACARIQNMDAGEFFGRFARLMKDNPPTAADADAQEAGEPRHRTRKDFDIKRMPASPAL